MKEIKKICIIADAYPTDTYPANVFIENFVCAVADKGIECVVVAPISITRCLKNKLEIPKREYKKTTENGNIIRVYRPRMISFSDKGLLKSIKISIIEKLFFISVNRIIKKINFIPDLFYGHFLHPAGITSAKLGKYYGVPSFAACGENNLAYLDNIGLQKIKKLLLNINGIIAVSTSNKLELIKKDIVDEKKIEVFNNAINNKKFRCLDKVKARNELGYSQDDFIVCFVGRFLEVKGPLRLAAALRKLPGVKSIFIGKGDQKPECEGLLFCGGLSNEEVSKYLNASDVFVLPTMAEGCCNAIVEAMACGLPIISSNLPFNDDILHDDNSIRINPNDIEEIKEAILLIKDNKELRIKMSNASFRYSAEMTLEKRAENVLSFMTSRIKAG